MSKSVNGARGRDGPLAERSRQTKTSFIWGFACFFYLNDTVSQTGGSREQLAEEVAFTCGYRSFSGEIAKQIPPRATRAAHRPRTAAHGSRRGQTQPAEPRRQTPARRSETRPRTAHPFRASLSAAPVAPPSRARPARSCILPRPRAARQRARFHTLTALPPPRNEQAGNPTHVMRRPRSKAGEQGQSPSPTQRPRRLRAHARSEVHALASQTLNGAQRRCAHVRATRGRMPAPLPRGDRRPCERSRKLTAARPLRKHSPNTPSRASPSLVCLCSHDRTSATACSCRASCPHHPRRRIGERRRRYRAR